MKLMVIGNITIDKIYSLNEFPRSGETLLANSKSINLGGKGLNQAVVAARSGLVEVQFLSVIGNQREREREMIVAYLEENGITADLFERGQETDESIIFTNQAGENIIVSTDMLAKSLKPEEVAQHIASLEPSDGILLQGNLAEKTTRYCIEEAALRGVKVLINLAPIEYRLQEVWDKIDYMLVNEEEVRFLTGRDNLKAAMQDLRNSALENVVITLGKKGAVILREDGSKITVAASRVQAVDTTGAGDTFTGIFSVGILAGLNMEEAASWAAAAAGITVSRKGTSDAFPSRAEIKRLKEELA